MKFSLKIILVFILFSIGITACNSFKEPEYRRLDRFEFTTFSLHKIQFRTDLVMYNPNNIGTDLLDSDVDLYINDKILGKSKQANAIRVNKISEFAIPISVDVATGQLNLSFLKSMWESMSKGKVKISVKGNCRLRKAGVPFNIPINYSENVKITVPDLF